MYINFLSTTQQGEGHGTQNKSQCQVTLGG